MPQTRFGLQPGYGYAVQKFGGVRAISRLLNIPYGHLYRSLTGQTPPNDRVRESLPLVLDRPLTELFTPDAIAARFIGRRGPQPGWREEKLAAIGVNR